MAFCSWSARGIPSSQAATPVGRGHGLSIPRTRWGLRAFSWARAASTAPGTPSRVRPRLSSPSPFRAREENGLPGKAVALQDLGGDRLGGGEPGHPQQGAAPAQQPFAFQGPGGNGLPGKAVALQDLGGDRLGGGEKGDRRLVTHLKLPGHGNAGEQVSAGATQAVITTLSSLGSLIFHPPAASGPSMGQRV